MNNANQKTPVNFSDETFSAVMLSGSDVLRIGIVGAGSFAAFAAKAFQKVSGVKIVAVTDVNSESSKRLANEIYADTFDNLAW